jgi:hypothetical protein
MATKNDTTTMDEADLLEGAIEALREGRRRRAHEERLERYAEGKVDAATLAEVARREGTDGDLDDELRAFAPIGAEARDRFAARVIAQRKIDENAKESAPPASVVRPRVIPFRRLTVAMSALALAASLAFVLRTKSAEPPLPAYELSFVGGEQIWRGDPPSDPAAPHRFARGEHVRLFARPSTEVDGPVEARIFLRRGQDVRAWPTSIDVSSAGAVRVVASPESLPAGTEGDWDVIVAVGRPDALPGPNELDADHAAHRGFRLMVTRVQLAP